MTTLPEPVLDLDIATATATGSTTARTMAARFGDVANVLDYGGGVGGDDALAIRNALATGKKTIVIPPGSYVMKSRPNHPGPFNFVPPPCVLFNGNQNVRVIAYGADFTFDASLCVPNTAYSNAGPSYVGYIGNCKNVRWSGGTFHAADLTNLGAAAPNAMWFQNVTRVIVEDTEMPGVWGTGSAFAGVWMFDCALRRNVCYGAGVGFDFAYLENFEVSGNNFDGGVAAGNTASVGFKLFSDPNTATFNTAGLTLAVVTNADGSTRALRNGQSNSVRLHHNTLSGWHSNVFLDGTAGVDIAANTITASASAFPTSNAVVIDTAAATNTAGYTTHDITVRNNEIYGNGGPAIGINTEAYGLGGVRITDNRIYDNTCPNAIYFYNNSPLGTIVIEDNDFTSRAGLSVQGAAVSVGNAAAIVAAGGVYQNNLGVSPYNQYPVLTVTGTTTLGTSPFGTGTTPVLIARQIANGNDTLLFQRFTDTTPTGSLLRYANAANSANLAVISITGNAIFSGGLDATVIGATTPAAATVTTLAANGGTLSLSNGTSNQVSWAAAGTGAPTFTARSAGTKLILYPVLDGTHVDYGMGIAGSTLWSSVPSTGEHFAWYAGTTNIANLSSASFGLSANITATGGMDATTIGATTPAAASVTQLNLTTSAGANIRSGTGAASGTQPKGSVWMRTDGGVGTTMYVSQGGGTWNAVAGV